MYPPRKYISSPQWYQRHGYYLQSKMNYDVETTIRFRLVIFMDNQVYFSVTLFHSPLIFYVEIHVYKPPRSHCRRLIYLSNKRSTCTSYSCSSLGRNCRYFMVPPTFTVGNMLNTLQGKTNSYYVETLIILSYRMNLLLF